MVVIVINLKSWLPLEEEGRQGMGFEKPFGVMEMLYMFI